MSTRRGTARPELAKGMRAGVPYAIASGMVGVSFGVLARPLSNGLLGWK